MAFNLSTIVASSAGNSFLNASDFFISSIAVSTGTGLTLTLSSNEVFDTTGKFLIVTLLFTSTG